LTMQIQGPTVKGEGERLEHAIKCEYCKIVIFPRGFAAKRDIARWRTSRHRKRVEDRRRTIKRLRKDRICAIFGIGGGGETSRMSK